MNDDEASASDLMVALDLTHEQLGAASEQLAARGLVRIDGFLGAKDDTPDFALVLTAAAKQ